MDAKTIARFWSKVDRGGPDECWEWQAHRMPNGYGQMGIRRRVFLAHRLAYCIGNSSTLESIEDWCVMHSCDNRACVNPAHLSLGTYLDNYRDMAAKGRAYVHKWPVTRGTEKYNARFSEDDIREMRRLVANGTPQSEVARLYKVDQGWISRIARRIAWKHVP